MQNLRVILLPHRGSETLRGDAGLLLQGTDALLGRRHFRPGLLQAGTKLAQLLQSNIPGHLRRNSIRLLGENLELRFCVVQVFLVTLSLLIEEFDLPRRCVYVHVLLNVRIAENSKDTCSQLRIRGRVRDTD